ncbi:MAG: CHASE2 domain-containing protein [Fimbriimonas sp.]
MTDAPDGPPKRGRLRVPEPAVKFAVSLALFGLFWLLEGTLYQAIGLHHVLERTHFALANRVESQAYEAWYKPAAVVYEIDDTQYADCIGRPGRCVDRDWLATAVERLFQAGARGVAVDIDFSPFQAIGKEAKEPPGPVSHNDFDFMRQMLTLKEKYNRPIVLGVWRGQALPPEGWLGGSKYRPLAASMGLPRKEETRVDLLRRLAYVETGTDLLPSLATALVGQNVARQGWSNQLFQDFEVVKIDGFDATLRFEVSAPALLLAIQKAPLKRPEDARDRYVIIGRKDGSSGYGIGDRADLYSVPLVGTVTGAQLHALHTANLAKGPVREPTALGGRFLDFLFVVCGPLPFLIRGGWRGLRLGQRLRRLALPMLLIAALIAWASGNFIFGGVFLLCRFLVSAVQEFLEHRLDGPGRLGPLLITWLRNRLNRRPRKVWFIVLSLATRIQNLLDRRLGNGGRFVLVATPVLALVGAACGFFMLEAGVLWLGFVAVSYAEAFEPPLYDWLRRSFFEPWGLVPRTASESH